MNTLGGLAIRLVGWLYDLLGFNLMHDVILVATSVGITLAIITAVWSVWSAWALLWRAVSFVFRTLGLAGVLLLGAFVVYLVVQANEQAAGVPPPAEVPLWYRDLQKWAGGR